MEFDFTLREMTAADGSAINALAAQCPDGGSLSIFSQFRENAFESLQALRPDTVGVVAEISGHEGLAGMAQISFDHCRLSGSLRPRALLNTLMVHPACRRKGLAVGINQWRIDKARRRFGNKGIIMANILAGNKASEGLHARWYEQMLPPVTVVSIRPADETFKELPGLTVRSVSFDGLAEFAHGLSHFYDGYTFFKPETAGTLAAWLSEKPFGLAIHHCLGVYDSGGGLLAGLTLDEAHHLRTFHVLQGSPGTGTSDRVRHPIPFNGIIREVFVHRFWFRPGHSTAARYLLEKACRPWRKKGISAMALFDARGPIAKIVNPRPGAKKTQLRTVVKAPIPILQDSLLYPVI